LRQLFLKPKKQNNNYQSIRFLLDCRLIIIIV
jgi:hypothetical protein